MSLPGQLRAAHWQTLSIRWRLLPLTHAKHPGALWRRCRSRFFTGRFCQVLSAVDVPAPASRGRPGAGGIRHWVSDALEISHDLACSSVQFHRIGMAHRHIVRLFRVSREGSQRQRGWCRCWCWCWCFCCCWRDRSEWLVPVLVLVLVLLLLPSRPLPLARPLPLPRLLR